MKVVASPLRKKPTPAVPEFNQWRLVDEVEEGVHVREFIRTPKPTNHVKL